MAVATALIGLLLGAAGAWLWLRTRVVAADARAEQAARDLEHERRLREEQQATFSALARDALDRNSQSFLELARTQLERMQVLARGDLEKEKLAVAHLVQPIKESLERVDGQVKTLDRGNSALLNELRNVAQLSRDLRAETGSLVTALRAPATRGRWGEMQLRNAVEAAGMSAFCDFVQQATAT